MQALSSIRSFPALPVSGFYDVLPVPGRNPHVRFRIASDSLPAAVSIFCVKPLKPDKAMKFSAREAVPKPSANNLIRVTAIVILLITPTYNYP